MLYVHDAGVISISNRNVTWKIYKFFSLPLNVGSEIRSQQFVYGDSRYILYIWPRGLVSGTKEWLGIFLYKYDAPGIGDSVQFSIVTDRAIFKTCTVECSENRYFKQERFIEWSDFETLSHKLAPGGCLTVVCRLPIENGTRRYKESVNNSEGFVHHMNDPPVKYLSREYNSPDPYLVKSTFKISSPETQAPSFITSGPLTTVDTFYKASFFENSFEFIPESAETRNSVIKLPYSATGENRKNFSDEEVIPAHEPKPETSLNTEVNMSHNKTSKSVPASTKSPPTAENYPKMPNISGASSVKNGLLSVKCQRLKQSVEPPTSTAYCPKGLKIMSQQYKNLYLEGKFFDLTISMEGKEFNVLKAFLMARSPVFKKMFSENPGKITTNKITIDPFDACNSSAFHDFLIYVYSGDIENLSEKNIPGVFSAALKFEMPELQEECIKFLKSSLSIDTITDVLRSANKDSELMDLAIAFFARNMEVIMQTDAWKQFMREEPDRAVEFIQNALKIAYTKTLV